MDCRVRPVVHAKKRNILLWLSFMSCSSMLRSSGHGHIINYILLNSVTQYVPTYGRLLHHASERPQQREALGRIMMINAAYVDSNVPGSPVVHEG